VVVVVVFSIMLTLCDNVSLAIVSNRFDIGFFQNIYIINFYLLQCPCVTLPGADKCITYDPRFQASTVEEAIVSFSDLTLSPSEYERQNSGRLLVCIFSKNPS
jgi:hypothetical protein